MKFQQIIILICILNIHKAFATLNYKDSSQNQDEKFMAIFLVQVEKYDRQYINEDEKNFRFQIFVQNLQQIEELNSQQKDLGTNYDLNKFFDISDSEFSSQSQFDSKYLNQDQYQAKNKLFDKSDYQSKQLLNEDTKNEFLKTLFENDQIDPIKLILEVRQNKRNNKHDFFNSENWVDFEEFFINEHFFKTTKFDIVKEEENLGKFFEQQFPNYDITVFTAQFNIDDEKSLNEFQQNMFFPKFEQFEKQLHKEDTLQEDIPQRRLQSILNPFQQQNQTRVQFQDDSSSIHAINRQYFYQRQHKKENPAYKNPFDQISSNPNYYNNYSQKRSHINTDINKNNWNKKTVVIDGIEIPAYLNWNENGLLNRVKDQKDCNACYAFGANASIEAHQILKNKNFMTYSEQEVLDCNYSGNDCEGGQPYLVFDYIKKFGIHSNLNYPYIGEKSQCKNSNLQYQKSFNLLKGYMFIKQGMKNLILATAVGPTVAISYASKYFKFYKSGIYYGAECNKDHSPNHTSLVYGYNFNANVPYLMLKTNWGSSFGINGHFKQAIGDLSDDNYGTCYLANTPYNVMPIV